MKLRPRIPGARRRGNPDGTMSLVEHLYELRNRLIAVSLAVIATGILAFFWYSHSLFGIPALGTILLDPYCSLDGVSRAEFTADGSCKLLATTPFEQFSLRLKVSLSVGVVLAGPVIFYQLWSFITPGLHKNERRYAISFVTAAALLFLAGAVIAYLVVAHAFHFLLTIGDDVQVSALTGDAYFGFILQLLVLFGISFEIPLLIVALNLVGILSYRKLSKWRRGIFFGLFVFAAVVTPSGDPFSMLALAVALCVLCEIAMQITRYNDRRKRIAGAEDPEEWAKYSDDEATPLGTGPGQTGTPTSVPRPEPVPAAARVGTPADHTNFEDTL